MAAPLSIKLRCASWQQLATIYRRDLSRGSMFLKASNQPPIGTAVKIDLELPSATVIELSGSISAHVTDPQRGTGVDIKLEPLPTKSVWMIESALAAEQKVRAQTGSEVSSGTGPQTAISDGEDVAAAESELLRALESEVESLRKLNPFLVLGVGYDSDDAAVRAAFGELTKRYHPDRFARYQSAKLRQIAAEIFILIRDAYRKLTDADSRAQALAQVQPRPGGRPPPPPRAATQPGAAKTPPKIVIPPARATPPGGTPAAAAPPAIPPGAAVTHDSPTNPGSHDAPTNQSSKPAELASSELAKGPTLDAKPQRTPSGRIPNATAPIAPGYKAPNLTGSRPPTTPPAPAASAADANPQNTELAALETLLDEGKLDEAHAGYKAAAKKNPSDRAFKAGVELCEGLRALTARDRLEAAQRFEAALEIDPSNERAARELADMRRQATNERKGLLSRLMGKKETP